MKKFLLPILLIMMFVPFKVNAKEYCKVVSGNGKDIGSEIACGTEHFYIINSNNDEIKMLAKYNLMVGNIIYKEKIEKEEEDTRTDDQYCNDLAELKEGKVRSDYFYYAPGYCFIETPIDDKIALWYPQINDSSEMTETCNNHTTFLNENDEDYAYEYYKYDIARKGIACFYKKRLKVKEYRQSEEAVSAHWNKDDDTEYLYPQVGDVYIHSYIENPGTANNNFTDFYLEPESGEKYENYFYDLRVGNGSVSKYINQYRETLITDGYDVNRIDLLTLDEINDFAKKSNKMIPYEDWYNHTREIVPPHYEFGNLKDFLTKKEAFIYSTTYWLRTGYDLDSNNYGGGVTNQIGVKNIAFVNSLGGVCGSGTNISSGVIRTCYYYLKLDSLLGAGIRPVITIPNELEYLIKTEIDDNGKIEVVENSLGGETIQFKISVNKGYKLGSIVIKTDSGEEVEFSEGEITKNDDGTFSIDKNKFTMPFENVTIQAKFESENILKNPETGDKILIKVLLIITFLGIGTHLYKKERI